MKDFGDLRSLCAEYRWHAAEQLAHELGAHALQYYADMVSGWKQLPSMEWATSVEYSAYESLATVEGITSRPAYQWRFESVTATDGVYVRELRTERVRYRLHTFGAPKFDALSDMLRFEIPPPPTHVFYHTDYHAVVFERAELVVVFHHVEIEYEVYPDE